MQNVPQARSLNIAIIGTGMVARTHLQAVRDANPAVRLAGVHSRRSDRAGAFAAQATEALGYPVKVFSDVNAIASDDTIDVVLILTPPDARLEIVGPLSQAGKAILLEKPIGRTLSEAREIVALCEASGATLGVFFQHRMREASVVARRRIARGEFGALGLVDMSVPWWREQGYYDEPGRGTYARDGGGVLISQAIHTIDLALTLAGPVAEVTAMTGTSNLHDMEAEDTAAAGLRFENGALGWLTASTACFPGAAESISLHFEKASLRLQEGTLVITWRNGRTEMYGESSATGGGADPMAFTHAWHQAVLEDFCAALVRDSEPAITGRSALAAHVLIDAVTRSARTGRRVALSETGGVS